jgi:glycosyltransferase involved in cell wall biosynthesis
MLPIYEMTKFDSALCSTVTTKTKAQLVSPEVSVVIATYNRAILLPRAIQSVFRQSYQDFEIIIVDDCSSDNTREVVLSMCDPRIRYIRHNANRGPAGRNTGITAARGQYIAFLDDDDEWRQDKLEKQLKVAETSDAVVSGALINKNRVKLHRKPFVTLHDLRKGNEFSPSSLLARASVFANLRFDENLRQGEDWDALIRIAGRFSIGYVAEPLLFYNDGSHTRMTSEAKNLPIAELETRMRVLYKHRDFFGPFWFKHHVAMTLLSYFFYRDKKVAQLFHAIRQCGFLPVICAFGTKIMRRLRRFNERLLYRLLQKTI